jgi:hypothetical protein
MYVIGTPGSPPRLYVSLAVREQIELQLKKDEVYFEVDAIPDGPTIIAKNGKTLAPGTIQIELVKDKMWFDTKMVRDRLMYAGYTTPHGVIDTDTRSRALLATAIQQAMIAKISNEDFKISWTMQGNNEVELTADQLIEISKLISTNDADYHQRSQAVRDKILAAKTVKALDAIDVVNW